MLRVWILCFVVGFGAAHASVQDADLRDPPRGRLFSYCALEFSCVTGPEMVDWSPMGRHTFKPGYEATYQILRHFLTEVVFLKREATLYNEADKLYNTVYFDVLKGEVYCHTHTPYTVRVGGSFLDLLQESYRQKNIAFMTDLWRMSLDNDFVSSSHGIQTLRRLAYLLGAQECAHKPQEPRSFLSCLEGMTSAHRSAHLFPQHEDVSAELKKQATLLLMWADTYAQHHGYEVL